VHEHQHPEEEVWNVFYDRLEIWVDGETRTLRSGDVAVIPPDVPHRLRALTPSRALVIDAPVGHHLPGTSPHVEVCPPHAGS
jgi:quercetin dioxygenase-like cupin family protein